MRSFSSSLTLTGKPYLTYVFVCIEVAYFFSEQCDHRLFAKICIAARFYVLPSKLASQRENFISQTFDQRITEMIFSCREVVHITTSNSKLNGQFPNEKMIVVSRKIANTQILIHAAYTFVPG